MNKSSGSYRKKKCELCLRDFPRDAIEPLKHRGDTLFVCSECADDERTRHTESYQEENDAK